MTNTPEEIKALAVRKLREFDLWRGLAGFPWVVYDPETYLVTPYGKEQWSEWDKWKKPPNKWQRLAPEETNAIIEAVNKIGNCRHRLIIVSAFLSPVGKDNRKIRAPEIWERIAEVEGRLKPLASSSYYRDRERALFTFAKLYRDGLLETWSE